MDEEIKRHRKELEKAMTKKDGSKALELLRALDAIPMTLDVLQSTHIGAIVNKARKVEYSAENTEITSLARKLVKRWKNQIPNQAEKLASGGVGNNAGSTTNNSNNNNDKTSSVANLNNNGNSSNNNNNGISSGNQSESSSAPKTDKSSQPAQPQPGTSSGGDMSRGPDRAHFSSEIPHTTCEVRLTIRKQLTDALKRELPKELSLEPFLEEEVLAAQIEDCIHQEFKNTDMKYRNRCRSRVSNLRDPKNPYLRYNVLRGDIRPDRIAKMTAEEMASDELKRQREKFTKEAINDHQMALTTGTTSSDIKCNACKKYNVTYNQVQTRSADEPMTTFCYCNDCGKRWKFC